MTDQQLEKLYKKITCNECRQMTFELFKQAVGELNISAHKVSFPEPIQDGREQIYTISPEFIEEVNNTMYSMGGFVLPDNQIEYVLLAFQKLMNEGNV